MLEAVVVGDYLYIDGGENYTYDQATRTRGFTIRQFGRWTLPLHHYLDSWFDWMLLRPKYAGSRSVDVLDKRFGFCY